MPPIHLRQSAKNISKPHSVYLCVFVVSSIVVVSVLCCDLCVAELVNSHCHFNRVLSGGECCMLDNNMVCWGNTPSNGMMVVCNMLPPMFYSSDVGWSHVCNPHWQTRNAPLCVYICIRYINRINRTESALRNPCPRV